MDRDLDCVSTILCAHATSPLSAADRAPVERARINARMLIRSPEKRQSVQTETR
jgi:hypothetical protein